MQVGVELGVAELDAACLDIPSVVVGQNQPPCPDACVQGCRVPTLGLNVALAYEGGRLLARVLQRSMSA
jgi:hypothetical protein